jgi:hypothetical protein
MNIYDIEHIEFIFNLLKNFPLFQHFDVILLIVMKK